MKTNRTSRSFGYSFQKSYLPPRCRKLRYREVQGQLTYQFRTLTDTEAPIVIVQHNANRQNCSNDHYRYGNGRKMEYRWNNERLWIPVRLSDIVCLNGAKNRAATIKDVYLNMSCHDLHDHQSVQTKMTEQLDSQWCLINGKAEATRT